MSPLNASSFRLRSIFFTYLINNINVFSSWSYPYWLISTFICKTIIYNECWLVHIQMMFRWEISSSSCAHERRWACCWHLITWDILYYLLVLLWITCRLFAWNCSLFEVFIFFSNLIIKCFFISCQFLILIQESSF